MPNMLKFILKRIGISFVTILVLVTTVFFMVRLMPGGPFASDKMTPEIQANMNAYYGFDKPVVVQYFQYVGRLLQGNFGYSMKYTNRTVNSIILDSFPFSADLGVRSLVFAIVLGLLFGIVAALHRGKKLDFISVMIAIIGTCVPDFIIGTLLQYLFGIRWHWLPVAGYDTWQYTILPAVALGFYTLAQVTRLMRSSMLEVVGQDYIKTAKSKGLSQVRVVVKHEMRNAIMPVITVLGPQIASVLTGTFVIESIFAIPGMGRYYVESINGEDYTLILGMTVFFGVFLVFANMIVDVLYGVIDPRVRVQGKAGE